MIRRDELYGLAKILGWDLGELTGHFLERGVRDAVPSQTFPIVNPETTKSAIAVVNQQRTISWVVGTLSHWVSVSLSHRVIVPS